MTPQRSPLHGRSASGLAAFDCAPAMSRFDVPMAAALGLSAKAALARPPFCATILGLQPFHAGHACPCLAVRATPAPPRFRRPVPAHAGDLSGPGAMSLSPRRRIGSLMDEVGEILRRAARGPASARHGNAEAAWPARQRDGQIRPSDQRWSGPPRRHRPRPDVRSPHPGGGRADRRAGCVGAGRLSEPVSEKCGRRPASPP